MQKSREDRKTIAEDTIKALLDWTDCHTYYVQLLCNRIYLASGGGLVSPRN